MVATCPRCGRQLKRKDVLTEHLRRGACRLQHVLNLSAGERLARERARRARSNSNRCRNKVRPSEPSSDQGGAAAEPQLRTGRKARSRSTPQAQDFPSQYRTSASGSPPDDQIRNADNGGKNFASTAEGCVVSIATLQQEILALLGSRAKGKTCCPSEIPRVALKLPDWRQYMPDVRAAAFDLQRAGAIDVIQNGRTIATEEVVGPIRLRLKEQMQEGGSATS